MNQELEQFAKKFLTGRINWWAVPRQSLTNFGVIISLIIYRKAPFQVELVISPHSNAEFTKHRHPNVNSFDFPLAGNQWMNLNGQLMWTEEQMEQWLKGEIYSPPVAIGHNDYHHGGGKTPYAFLSIQQWLNGVEPKDSVGLDWEGPYSGLQHQQLVETSGG